MRNKKTLRTRYLLGGMILLTGLILASCGGSSLTPLGAVPVELEGTVPQEIAAIPGVSEETLTLFASNCASCHGTTGQGSAIAPPLNSEALRARLDDDAIADTIANGRAGTAMPDWGSRLSDEQIASLVTLIRNWGELGDEQLAEMEAQAPAVDCGGMGHGTGMGRGMGMGGRHGPMGGGGCSAEASGSWGGGNRP